MMDAATFLAVPFAATVVFVLIHAYFGVQVLERRVVFADLALAQLAALGGTIAFAAGHAPATAAAFAYALAFTLAGAGLLAFTRMLSRHVSQEAFVGIVYVAAMALTILVVDRSPQGAEHVKRMLIGNLLVIDTAEVAKLALLYSVVGAIAWALRTRLAGAFRQALFWSDLLFYAAFGVVVTSSVSNAGVLLVFSFLIMPAVIGLLFSRRFAVVLVIAWAAGIVASALGLAASYAFDLPTGAAIVVCLAGALVVAGAVRVFAIATPAQRSHRVRGAAKTAAAVLLVSMLGSAVWLLAQPAADQPLLALFERVVGVRPSHFLSPAERDTFEASERDGLRFASEIERLNAREREARPTSASLSDDEVRRIASYQRSFAEMARGERFVQDVLRAKARARERWWIGLPAALLAVLGLAVLLRRHSRGSNFSAAELMQ